MLEFSDDEEGLDMTPVAPANLSSARLPSQQQYRNSFATSGFSRMSSVYANNESYRDNDRNENGSGLYRNQDAAFDVRNAAFDNRQRRDGTRQQHQTNYFTSDGPSNAHRDRQQQQRSNNDSFDDRQRIPSNPLDRLTYATAATSSGSYRTQAGTSSRLSDNTKKRSTKSSQKTATQAHKAAHDYGAKKHREKMAYCERHHKMPFYLYQEEWLDSIHPHSQEEYEHDPFDDYPALELRSGVIVTDELPVADYPYHSFYAYCQDNQKFYIVPRLFTTPPPGLKLTIKNRWDRKFELEFGKLIFFKVEENSDEILVFRKGPTDNIPVEVVSGHNCFIIKVVFNEDFTKLHTFEFGSDEVTQPIERIIPDLVYDCYVEFDVVFVKKGIKRLKVFRIDSVSTEQHIASSAPWWSLALSKIVGDTEEEIIEIPVIANKRGLRYSSNGVLNLEDASINELIRICHDREKAWEIGTLFQFDYLSHPNSKFSVVTAIYEFRDILEYREIEDDVFGFLIAINLQTHNNGFYTHNQLGMIANSNGCLRFLPYSNIRPPDWDPEDETIKVYVKVVFHQPAKFDIYDLPPETWELVNQCEPKSLAVHHLLLMGNGRCYSSDYPNLKLYIHDSQKEKLKMGDILKGKFERNSREGGDGNTYVSTEIEKLKTEPWKALKVTDAYGFFVFRGNVIKYDPPPSNKTIKKNPAKDAESSSSSDYHFRFNGCLECPDTGLISGIKYNPDSTSSMQFVIAEINLNQSAQTAFKYFSPYHSEKHTLDTDTNSALVRRINRVLGINLNEEELVDVTQPEPQRAPGVSAVSISRWRQSEVMRREENHIPAINEPDPLSRETISRQSNSRATHNRVSNVTTDEPDPLSREASSRQSNSRAAHSRVSNVIIAEPDQLSRETSSRQSNSRAAHSRVSNVTADEPGPSRSRQLQSPLPSNNIQPPYQPLFVYTPLARNEILYRQNPAIHEVYPDIFLRIEELAYLPPRPSQHDQIRLPRNEAKNSFPEIDEIAKAYGVYN